MVELVVADEIHEVALVTAPLASIMNARVERGGGRATGAQEFAGPGHDATLMSPRSMVESNS